MTTGQTTRPESTARDRDGTDGSNTPAPGTATRPAGEGHPESELSLDLVFEALKNSRRRQVVGYLQAEDSAASVSELAEHVAAIENDTTVEALSSQQRKRVYVGLYQCHLPKLDDIDVVDYDDDRGTVELGPNADELTRYVNVAETDATSDDRPWHRYYLGVASAGAVLFVTAVLASGGTLGTAATVTGAGLVVGLTALSLAHANESATAGAD